MNNILKANAKIICENKYTISENGLVAFSVMVVSSESATVRLTAETASYADYVELGGELGCRNAGKLRQEGKEYVVQDGDVMHFKFNV